MYNARDKNLRFLFNKPAILKFIQPPSKNKKSTIIRYPLPKISKYFPRPPKPAGRSGNLLYKKVDSINHAMTPTVVNEIKIIVLIITDFIKRVLI